MNIIVVGVGNLGARHIESLLELPDTGTIYAVDPSLDALRVCREQLEDKLRKSCLKVNFVKTMDCLPNAANLAIIATNSKVRCAVIFELLEKIKVDYLILEKVLFPCLSEYEKVQNLFLAKKTKAWVNHARREYDFYQELKQSLVDDIICNINVTGGDWGLGCNSLHFMDLFEYLTDSKIDRIFSEMLDSSYLKSKRSGYVEFNGTLYAKSCSASLTITSHNHRTPVSISIDTNMKNLTIFEGISSVCEHFHNAGFAEIKQFERIVEYQSSLTCKVALKLISNGNCSLPTFEEASRLHCEFLSALLDKEFIQGKFKEGYVPIT